MLFPYYDNLKNRVKTNGIRGVNANLYKNDTIIKHNIRFNPEIKIAEDAIFNFDVISHSTAVMMCDWDVGYYRVSQGSVMHKYTPNILETNDKTIEAYYSRVEKLIENDMDYKRAFVGMVAECVFRALKLYFIHPNNTDSIRERVGKFKNWIQSNQLVKDAIKDAELNYLPIGKRQIMHALQHNQYLLGGIGYDGYFIFEEEESDINNIFVSIIIPVYKVPEQYLRQCIESCINQTMREIEIILVDDGSPDDCGKICDEYAERDARVLVIHKENGGLAAARNTGQDAAIGETLMFLDGDDYLELDCCEIAYSKLKDNDVELVMFDQYVNYPNSQMEQKSFNDGLGERLFVGEECRKLQARVLDFNGRIAMAFMKLIRLDYLRKYNIRHIDELRQGAEGFVVNIQLYEHLERAYYIDKPLLHYIYNGQSISHTASVKNNILIVRCLEGIDEEVGSGRNTMDVD